MYTLFYITIAMIIAMIMNRLAKAIGLPHVTAYLITGLLVGPSFLNIIPTVNLEELGFITTIALGFIAFSIGGEFKLVDLKKIGKSVLIVALLQSLTAALFVSVGLVLCGQDLALALTMGAIASATAPAATLMVVRQYKAKGKLTQLLLPVVALDDAIGLILFSICLSISKTLYMHTQLSFMCMVVNPLTEILLSLTFGAAIGFLLTYCLHFFKSRANRLTVMIIAVFLGVSGANLLNLSSLLLCMMIGTIMANFYKDNDYMMRVEDRWTTILFMAFFILSGAELDFSILPSVGLIGIIYFLARTLGKYIGSNIGCRLMHESKKVSNYIGLTLLPQAGVAIGMMLIVTNDLPSYSDTISTVVLSATLVYELIGPLLTKIALTKAGDIVNQNKAHTPKHAV